MASHQHEFNPSLYKRAIQDTAREESPPSPETSSDSPRWHSFPQSLRINVTENITLANAFVRYVVESSEESRRYMPEIDKGKAVLELDNLRFVHL